MNIERFHNQLALRLGYDRIVNNKRMAIKVDYKNPNDPWMEIEFPEGIAEGFNASEDPALVHKRFSRSLMSYLNTSDLIKREIEGIVEATHQAYRNSIDDCLFPYL